jgi:hypothetical protein
MGCLWPKPKVDKDDGKWRRDVDYVGAGREIPEVLTPFEDMDFSKYENKEEHEELRLAPDGSGEYYNEQHFTHFFSQGQWETAMLQELRLAPDGKYIDEEEFVVFFSREQWEKAAPLKRGPKSSSDKQEHSRDIVGQFLVANDPQASRIMDLLQFAATMITSSASLHELHKTEDWFLHELHDLHKLSVEKTTKSKKHKRRHKNPVEKQNPRNTV